MKKFVAFLFCAVSCFGLVACPRKTELEIKKASKTLSSYDMEITYNNDYTLDVNQSINYINSSNVNFDKIY